MFHPEQTIYEHDAVERFVCLELQKAPVVLMDSNQMKAFTALSLYDEPTIRSIRVDLMDHYMPAGFMNRVDHFPIPIDDRTKIFIILAFEEVGIGSWLLLAYYLEWWAYTNKRYAVQWQDVGLTIFPNGFPSKVELLRIWDNQKVSGNPDNLIDYPSARLSFMPAQTV